MYYYYYNILGVGPRADDPGANPAWDHLLRVIPSVYPFQFSTINALVA